VSFFGLLLSKPKKPFRLPERCALLAPIAPGEFVSEPLALLVGLRARPVLLCRPDTLDETDVFLVVAKGPLSRS
jgi:hypothetical protein